MSKYTTRKARIGTSLDELGITLGLERLEGEDLDSYRKRLALQAKVRPDQSEKSFIDTISRNVGLFEEDIFEIDLVLDSDGDPVAPAPRIEVTSSFLRVWSNYPDSEPELEVDIYNRGSGYLIGDLEDKLRALSFITVETLPKTPDLEEDSYKYKRSWNLKIGNSDRLEYNAQVRPMNMNRFYHEDTTAKKYISNCLFSSPLIFNIEVSSYDDLANLGDYYIDYTNGIIFTYGIGGGLVSFEYRMFPYTLTYQPVKVLPFEDKDINHLKKDYLVSDTSGKEERLSLSPYGAKVTNAVLKAYPLQWGE